MPDKCQGLEGPHRPGAEKIAELEAFNEATVGRELRMIELKRENEALRREMAELRRDRRR